MMLTNGIKRYFLRIYAAELHHQHRKRGPAALSPYGEALFQAMFVVVVIMLGVGSAIGVSLLLVPNPLASLMLRHRTQITVGFPVTSTVVAYLLVRCLVREYRQRPGEALPFDTARDRLIANVQYWCVVVVAIAIPLPTAYLIKKMG